MSILVEIAEKADVPVEGVVRVLTREPVSDAIKERVLEVLDDLTPEQTRAVQRFALAALHDVLQRPGDVAEAADGPVAPDPAQLALPVAAAEPDLLPSLAPDAALVQLSSVLGELAEAVRDLRRETDAERRERVDDLAVLIDLITTGWQGLDARLGRIERQVSRLESGRREPIAPAPMRAVSPVATAAPAPSEPVAAAPIEAAPVPPAAPPSPPVAPSKRDRLPFVAALALVGAGAVTLAVLQLASGGPDLSRLVSARESSSTTGEIPASTARATTTAETQPAATTQRPPTAPATTQATTRPATTSRPPAQRPTAPATTSDVLGTTAETTRPKPPAAPTAPGTTATPQAATTRPATTAASPPGFKPTRNWAWAPVQGADYYDVQFSRAGVVFYRASPTEPRLTLPESVVFRPGDVSLGRAGRLRRARGEGPGRTGRRLALHGLLGGPSRPTPRERRWPHAGSRRCRDRRSGAATDRARVRAGRPAARSPPPPPPP